MTLMNVLIYFMITVISTGCGVMFWLAIENIQPVRIPERRLHYFWTTAFVAVLFSPLLVWLGSLVFRYVKSRELARTSTDATGLA
jgi:hypothetical protein